MRAFQHAARLSQGDAPRGWIVEAMDRGCSSRGCHRLPDRLCPFDRNGGYLREKLIQLVVDDAASVAC
jgi:hypothetical protein